MIHALATHKKRMMGHETSGLALPELIKRSDIISLHCPLTMQTEQYDWYIMK